MDGMDIKEIKKELAALRKEIRYHNNRYYNEDSPTISDYDYDQLMLRLKAIEKKYPELVTKNSPTQMVGGSFSIRVPVMRPIMVMAGLARVEPRAMRGECGDSIRWALRPVRGSF